ncbi:MAG: hypothetical protein LBF40_06410 [Deltaproteobacteria bacterium]|jgi:hypothetical protein|nr:hypothetical protein [Deltaproteobacteria bacterium]
MKIDTFSTDAVFLRAKNESVATTSQKGGQEDFAALVEKAAKDAQAGLVLPEGGSGKSELNGSAQFLSETSLAQLQISRLKLNETGAGDITAQDAVKQVEETLSLLENYAIALGDPANTLKDLAPMAEELSLGADSLNSLSQGLSKGDPLKELSSDTAILAAVEALKFKRGDFV